MQRYENKRVLCFGCLHIPYHHRDAFKFLQAIKTEYAPDRVINMGDEVDLQSIKFHPQDPDLMNAGEELKQDRVYLKELEKIFPDVLSVKSNHGTLVHRRTLSAGLPRGLIRSYNKIYGLGTGWKWSTDLNLTMSDKSAWYFCHGKSSNALTLSKSLGGNAVQAHYHNSFFTTSWMNQKNDLYWGVQVGTLIDDRSFSFNYNKSNVYRPILGASIIIEGIPRLIPMILTKSGRWNGKL